MKKITVALIALMMLTMTICANANEASSESMFLETSSSVKNVPSQETVLESSTEEFSEITSDIAAVPVLGSTEQKDAPGEYDDKYHKNWKQWQSNYEEWVEYYLGIRDNPLNDTYGVHPERTEPWWDEWIAEMLSEGLIEQSWYDEMIAKGYIIEVD